MPFPDLEHPQKYTYSDYLTWDDGKRYEIIKGKVYPLEFGDDPQNMTPAPGRKHQEISGNIFSIIHQFLKGKTCKVYDAPFDVRLVEEEGDDTTLQPDISVFCDPTKLDEKGAIGPPDWVIEILSPSTEFKDKTIKAFLYQNHGVKEYWLVDPDKETVVIFQLMSNGKFGVPIEYKEGKLKTYFDDLLIEMSDIFT